MAAVGPPHPLQPLGVLHRLLDGLLFGVLDGHLLGVILGLPVGQVGEAVEEGGEAVAGEERE